MTNGKLIGRRRTFLLKLTLILFGLLVGAAIAEIALRIAGYSYPGFYTVDQTRGYALVPGMEGWYRKEGESYVRINSAGMRDREHPKTKPSDTFRIAVLGDSHAEALQVPVEQAFWSIMEKKLQACPAFAGKRVEVLNFGVSGYGTGQELITLREHVWGYFPDVIMLTMTTNNDISDNSRALKKTDEVPYFIFREGKLVLDDSFRASRAFRLRQSKLSRAGRWIKDHSRLVQAVNQGHHGLKLLLAAWRSKNTSNPPSAEAAEQKSDVIARSEELGVDNIIYLEPTTPVWTDAWEVTEGLVVAMRDEVVRRGAKFLVVSMSNGPQVLPDPKVRQAFMQRMGITDLFYPDVRIKSVADRESIPFVMLAPDLQKYAEQQQVFLHGFGQDLGNGHWNALGHARAGELIAQKLCEGLVAK